MRAPQAEKRLETVSMTTMFSGASSAKEPYIHICHYFCLSL